MSEQDMEVLNDSTEITFENAKTFLPRLPLSKTKKIAKMDSEYLLTANAAMVATTFATELFVQSLVENALAMNQLNHNNRNSKKDQNKKNARLTYHDIAESVQRLECFQFLEDVIPKVQTQQRTKNKDIQVNNTTDSNKKIDETEGETNSGNEDEEEVEDDAEDEVEEEDVNDKKDAGNTTAEINERNAINKQHTLSFFQKYQYSANNKSKKIGTNSKSNNNDSSDKNESDVEMIDADDSNSNEDDVVEEINDEDSEEDADEEDTNEEDTNEEDEKLQEQLSQIEQMDHVIDVDTTQSTTSPSKERMTLNRNQEDNNDLLSSSDSDSETDILRNIV